MWILRSLLDFCIVPNLWSTRSCCSFRGFYQQAVFFFFFFLADLVLRFSDFPKNASPVLELQSSSCRSLTLFLNLSPLKQTSILTAIIRFEGACQDEQRTRPHRKVQASLLTE